jgi:eukaryotic-like serine/threonine-protein kinase
MANAHDVSTDEFHRNHPFTLPGVGECVVSPLTGTAYEIGARLDEGAHGVVFLCSDEWGNDLVAKVLRPTGNNFVEIERKAVTEIAAQTLARAPHIVQIHDAFIFKGACLIVSERCHKALGPLIEDEGFDTAIWFPAMARSVLHALHFIHVHGVAHCDIHSGNVFLHYIPDVLLPQQNAAFTFKLGDFGQARNIESMAADGTFLNCIRPPEALQPEEFGALDHRSDVYQAGLLFMNFLTREKCAFTVEEIVAGAPRERAEELPFPFNEVVARMLRRHVEYRTSTALDVWRELRPLLFKH